MTYAPVLEETVFRAWIQRPAERRWGPAVAITSSAVLFALVHLDSALVPFYFIDGVIIGVTVWLTRSLWAGVVLHAAHNVFSTVTEMFDQVHKAWLDR